MNADGKNRIATLWPVFDAQAQAAQAAAATRARQNSERARAVVLALKWRIRSAEEFVAFARRVNPTSNAPAAAEQEVAAKVCAVALEALQSDGVGAGAFSAARLAAFAATYPIVRDSLRLYREDLSADLADVCAALADAGEANTP